MLVTNGFATITTHQLMVKQIKVIIQLNGSYAVEIFQNGCSAVSSCYTVNNLMSLSFNILDSIYCNGDLAEGK